MDSVEVGNRCRGLSERCRVSGNEQEVGEAGGEHGTSAARFPRGQDVRCQEISCKSERATLRCHAVKVKDYTRIPGQTFADSGELQTLVVLIFHITLDLRKRNVLWVRHTSRMQ